jgi:hypothetical protein
MALDQTMNDSTRLNDLYWSSSRTIDEIIGELGIEKKALYTLIQPLDAGQGCATCREHLVFTNRTNRASGTAVCVSCGSEALISEGVIRTEPRVRSVPPPGESWDENGQRASWTEELVSVAPERAALIGGAAALGVMVGAAAVKALRH